MRALKKEHKESKNRPENIVAFLERNRVGENSSEEQLLKAFNKLLKIPDLIRIIDENKPILSNHVTEANVDIRAKNKRKLAEIYPLTLEKSPIF